MEIYADNCNEILDKLKIKETHVIGKSMGGMIAQVFAAKFKTKVNKLVLACTCSSRDKINEDFKKIFLIDDYVRVLPTGSSKVTETG